MRSLLIHLFLLVILLSLAGQARADTVLYGSNPSDYSATTSTLNSYFPTGYIESVGGLFKVAGTSGSTQVTITLQGDNGADSSTLGYFVYNNTIPVDPTSASSLRTWAYNTISSGTTLFAGTPDDVGQTAIVSLPAGSIIGFWLLPTGSKSDFLANNAAGSSNYNPFTDSRWPLFTLPQANPNYSDQSFVFGGNIKGSPASLVSFEDTLRLTTNSSSDSDFNDVIFTAVNLSPVPEPRAFAWGGLVILLALLGIRSRRTALVSS